MPTKSIIEEAVTRLAEKKADAFFEKFDVIKAHLQKVWDAEKPKFEDAVENDTGNGKYRFPLDLSELGSIDKTQAEAVFQALPAFERISHWINVEEGNDKANPQKFVVVIEFQYQREWAIKNVMNERIEKRRREEQEKAEAEEKAAEAKKARAGEPKANPVKFCEKVPTVGQAILESALAGLGYSVEAGDGAALSQRWQRALINEFNQETSKAFKKAVLEVADKCPDHVPAMMATVKKARDDLADQPRLAAFWAQATPAPE
jgi:hypothetical protein